MSNEIFVDTLYLVALINTRDSYHARALELVDTFSRNSLVTTDAVLLEVGNALARSYKRQAIEIIQTLSTGSDTKIVHLTPELWMQAFALYRSRLDKEWGLVDCISFSVMQNRGITAALTFDQHFVQAGFAALMRE